MTNRAWRAIEASLSALTLRLCLKWCVLLSFTLTGFVTRRRHKTVLRAVTKEHKKIGVAYVSTAAALSDVQKEKVNARLLETTDFETIEMNYTVDESLLGGMVIRIGDRVVDTSIKNKLRELSKQLSALQVG